MAITPKNWLEISPFLPQNALKLTENIDFTPVFVDGGFCYKLESFVAGEKTWQYTFFNNETMETSPLFDHCALANALNKPVNALEITIVSKKNNVLTFICEENTYSWEDGLFFKIRCKDEELCATSPDGKQRIFVREGNLFLQRDSSSTVQLTQDGTPDFGYGIRNPGDNGFVSDKIAGRAPQPGVLWSPDNRHFLTWKLDIRQVNAHYLVQNAPESGRPILYSYKYALPGDQHIPLFTVWLGDCQNATLIEVEHPPMPMLFLNVSALLNIHLGWSDTGKTPLFCHMHRNHQQADYFKIDINTGKCTLLYSDISKTFLFFDFLSITRNQSIFHYFDKQDALFALTESSGFSQLIRIDSSGIHPVTKGDFVVSRLLYIDENWIYFSAQGKEQGTLPLHNYTYRVSTSGGEMFVLSRRRGNHTVFFSPNGDYFVSSVSSCDQPQTAVLCTLDGTERCEIVSGSCEKLEALGMSYPIAFCEKGSDGVTDIYGVIVMPSGFDSGKKYPVLDYYYGGNQTSNVPQTFFDYLNCGFIPAFAKSGVVSVVIDGRGSTGRGKAFHDACYQNMGACAGMEDHATVIKSLCHKFPFMDANRVGVWGHSGGGFAAYQCMVKMPELYKCAVSSGGNHLQELYVWDWAERFMGGSANVTAQSAELLAQNLQGKLLLIHGELDDNVHPSNTMRIVKSLIAADKDFDMLIMPNKHHRLSDDSYFQRKLITYMLENL